MADKPKLYDYWRSSAAYRVRIALNLKGIDYESVPIALVGKDGGPGEQHSDAYRAINPQGRVPFYDDGAVAVAQSMAILEYLEEAHRDVPLLPNTSSARADIRSFCNVIACEIHPLNNLSVMNYLKGDLGLAHEQFLAWYGHWIHNGFRSAEMFAAEHSGGTFVYGSTATLADAFLVPQMYNARRFKVDVAEFPKLIGIDARCLKLEAFAEAAPENQIDAKPT